jgi:GNAT superfamily N-acetyltransferase
MTADLCVRPITVADAPTAAALCLELGYPAPAAILEQRIRCFETMPDHTVLVACTNQYVVGWIDVGIVHHFQSDPYGEIGGFIVAASYRGSGIGRALIKKAEGWVADRGVKKMLVRSQVAREAAHRFYLREGYVQTKTSAVFTKPLS